MSLSDNEARALLALYQRKDLILGFFKENQNILTDPYRTERRPDCEWVLDDLRRSPICSMLVDAGLDPDDFALKRFGSPIRYLSRLDNDQQERAYALIDLCIKLVDILNVYEPRRALMQNIYATNVVRDALGRDDTIAAAVALDKVFRKARGSPEFYFGGDAAYVIPLIMYDFATRTTAQRSPGIDFERACEDALQELGFEVQRTPAVGDFGADLIAEKDNLTFAIQCKDSAKPSGIKAVQEAASARSHYRTDYAVVCSSGGFTDAAIELATSVKVILSNLDQLGRRLDSC